MHRLKHSKKISITFVFSRVLKDTKPTNCSKKYSRVSLYVNKRFDPISSLGKPFYVGLSLIAYKPIPIPMYIGLSPTVNLIKVCECRDLL